MEVPQQVLPCRHAVCDRCLQGCGRVRKQSVLLDSCPLHPEEGPWEVPTVVRYKPVGAGVRILSLDGGGVRGIAQLELLCAIQNALGGHMLVQTFFDLVVGTGTGGLIAAVLQTEGQNVERCLDMFAAICEHAYTPRLLLAPKSAFAPHANGFTLMRQIERAMHLGPRYKTGPLHEALKTTFTDEARFFSASGQATSRPKVVITATSATRGELMLLANYKQRSHPNNHYKFQEADDPVEEPKTWQCVAATMAILGKQCTNPADLARELARDTWWDVRHPDILLSLGTGQHRTAIVEKLRTTAPGSSDSDVGPLLRGPSRQLRNTVRRWRSGRDGDILRAEQDWQTLKAAANGHLHSKGLIRLNPDIGQEPPTQDRKDQLRVFQARVLKQLQEPHQRRVIEHVARRLVATTFYLVQAQPSDKKGTSVVAGSIACRLEDGSAELRAFGRFLAHQAQDGFEPYFSICPAPDSRNIHSRITITSEKIVRMVDDAVFERPDVLLRLEDFRQAFSINLVLTIRDELEPDGFPISGFPRDIIGPPNSSTYYRSVVPKTEGRAGSSGAGNPTISQSLFSRHPILRRHSTSSSQSCNTTWSRVIDSARGVAHPLDTWQDPRLPAKQHSNEDDVSSHGDWVARNSVRTPMHNQLGGGEGRFKGFHSDQLRSVDHVYGPNLDSTAVPRPLQPGHGYGRSGERGTRRDRRLVADDSYMAPWAGHGVNGCSASDTDTLNSFLGLYF